MTKTDSIIFKVATGLLSVLMLMSASMYFFKHDMVVEAYTKLHFPTFIIYPLAVAKIFGVISLWAKVPARLKEWVYAGFFFNLLLAVAAHLNVGDNEYFASLIGIVLMGVSYFYYSKSIKKA